MESSQESQDSYLDLFESQCSSEAPPSSQDSKDPYALDPCFHSKEEMEIFLRNIKQVDDISTDAGLEIEKQDQRTQSWPQEREESK